jgi:hypothetical protein
MSRKGFSKIVTDSQALICFAIMLALCLVAGYKIVHNKQEPPKPDININIDKNAKLPKIAELKPEYRDYPKLIELLKKCGHAEIQEEFEIENTFEKITDFIKNNKKEIMEEINIKLIEDLGEGKIKLKRQNNRGKFIWVAKEIVKKESNSFCYESNLIESIEGGIQEMSSKITISKIEEKCKIKVYMSVSVEGISSKDIKMDIKMKIRRLKKIVIENQN